MTTPPPRKFFAFQLHLSTAIVLMFVAGGLIWANFRERSYPFKRLNQVTHEDRDVDAKASGWPIPHSIYENDGNNYVRTNPPVNGGVFADIVAAFVIFTIVYDLSERLVNRRRAPA